MSGFQGFDFDFAANKSKNADSFWDRDSVKQDNNSFFSNTSNPNEKKQQSPQLSKQNISKSKSNKQSLSKISQSKPVGVVKKESSQNQISIGAFGDPEEPSQMKSSGISKRFNVQKQSEEEFRERAAGNMSRTLSDIDVSQFGRDDQGQYHFEKEMPAGGRADTMGKDESYEALKKYLSEPKKMDFNKFFGDLEQKELANSSFLKRKQYSNEQEFEEWKRRVKEEKRNEQLMRQYETNQQQQQLQSGKRNSKQISIPKVIEINHFKKKLPGSSSILSEEMIRFNNDESLENSLPAPSPAPGNLDFITFKSNPHLTTHPPTPQQFQDFFADDNPNPTSLKSQNPSPILPPPKSKLPVIVDTDQNIFETTEEEIKLNSLFGNFKKMMENYNLLRGELKSNTEGHEKLMKQLHVLKDDYNIKQQQYQKEQQTPQESFDKQSSNRLLKPEVQEKINQIQFDIYKRIENLENVVKETFDKENGVENNLVWVNPDFLVDPEKKTPEGGEKSRQKYGSREDANKFGQLTNNDHHHQHQSPSKQSFSQEIMSPLDLKLNNIATQEFNLSSRVSHTKSIAFSPTPKKTYPGQPYLPKHLSVDTNYKTTCIQDSPSIIFQSFDFIISAKYTFIRTGRKHLRITIKIKNKTILTLNDFMVIMYGSIGEVLQISPSKMFVEKLNPEETKTLEAIVDSYKLNTEPIRMQISYRTQRDRKGKISVSIPRPIVKFLDIRFTHESQFTEIWNSTRYQMYVEPRDLNFEFIKSTDDIKLIFPWIEVAEMDEREFSYGLIFSVLNVEGMMLLKLVCNVEGKGMVQVKFEEEGMRGYAREVLDVMNMIMFC